EFFARNRLSAYLDGELETGELREVEDALARSAELRAELEGLRAAAALLRVGGPVPAPKGFARRLDARLAEEPMRVGWRRHLHCVRAEAVLLAAAAAAVIVWAGKKPGDEPPPEAAPTAMAPTEMAKAEAPLPAPPDLVEDGATKPAVDMAGMPGVEPDADVAPSKADGVLGGEKIARTSKLPPEGKQQSFAGVKSTKASKSAKGDTEIVPYAPAWEQQGASVDAPPTVTASSQIRLTLTSDTGLKDLDAFARSLGGSLTDERGRQLPTYLLDIGETRKVKLTLPAATALSQGELYSRLQAFGTAELVSSGTFYPSGANVPVVIEVGR
ncbi:MAG: zf-HC2 domain-containing protein, partial [Myxococcota bacterium]